MPSSLSDAPKDGGFGTFLAEMQKPRCEKCRSDDVHVRWHGEGAYHPTRRHSPCYSDYGPQRGKPDGEHLHYVCRNCGYEWQGETADA